jgi:hypothetical protein
MKVAASARTILPVCLLFMGFVILKSFPSPHLRGEGGAQAPGEGL